MIHSNLRSEECLSQWQHLINCPSGNYVVRATGWVKMWYLCVFKRKPCFYSNALLDQTRFSVNPFQKNILSNASSTETGIYFVCWLQHCCPCKLLFWWRAFNLYCHHNPWRTYILRNPSYFPFLLDSLIPITHHTILFFKLPMPLNLPGSLKFFLSD